MKKTELRNIIRESINELIQENSNSNVTVSVGDIVAVAAAAGYGLTNPQDLPSPGINNTPNANPFYYLFGGNFNSIGMQQNVNGMSASSNCGYAEVFNIDSQAFANEFNNKMSGEIGVYIEIASGVNNAYNSLQSVLGQMNADYQGPVYGCTYVGVVSPPPPPPPLNPGCTDSSALNYDMYADGCPDVNGVVDVNDISCCMIQPGGGVTPTNVGPPMASNDTKFKTSIPSIEPGDPSDDIAKMQKRDRTKLNELSSSNLSNYFSRLKRPSKGDNVKDQVDNGVRADLIGIALPAIEQTSINNPQIAKLVSNLFILKNKYDTNDGKTLQQQPELVQMAVDYLSDTEALAAFSTITDIENAMAAALKAGADTLGGSTEKIYTANAFPDGMRDSAFYKNAVEDGYRFILKPYLNGRSAQTLPVGKDGFIINESILRMKKLANII
tara:strand:- start:59 stop:1381 length:1323 start_codon:yes stop_codon:yes gene_type:complete